MSGVCVGAHRKTRVEHGGCSAELCNSNFKGWASLAGGDEEARAARGDLARKYSVGGTAASLDEIRRPKLRGRHLEQFRGLSKSRRSGSLKALAHQGEADKRSIFMSECAAMVKAGADALIASEQMLTEYDSVAGDGDCGITMKRGASF